MRIFKLNSKILLSLLIVVGLLFWGGVEALAVKQVVITYDGQQLNVKTKADKVGDVIQEAGILLSGYDRVTPGLESPVTKNMTIDIKKAVEVTVVDGGNRQTLMTAAATIGDLIGDTRIELGEKDRINYELSTPVSKGMEIQITRVAVKTETEDKVMSFPLEKRRDSSMLKGEEKILQSGKEGLAREIYEVVYENGKQVSRRLKERVIVTPPVKQVVAFGVAQVASRGGKTFRYTDSFIAKATAYSPKAGDRTYIGIKPYRGIIATDPRVIPLGTKVYVDGYGYALAADIGSAIKGKRIDVFVDTEAEAVRWGVKYVRVFIIDE